MKDKTFVPRVAVVPVDGSVLFPNQDPVFHNVFSVSGANRFDLDLYKKPKSGAWVFRHPGLVRVYCNIHPQMSAYVLVRDNPFWARPSEGGSFEIQDVPPGAWVVKAWHERAGETQPAGERRRRGGARGAAHPRRLEVEAGAPQEQVRAGLQGRREVLSEERRAPWD